MKILEICGHSIKADNITGISDLQAIHVGDCLCDWEWGIKLYCNFEITITFGYGGNSNKDKAFNKRNEILKKWIN